MGSVSVPLLWYRQSPFESYLRNTLSRDEVDSTMPHITSRKATVISSDSHTSQGTAKRQSSAKKKFIMSRTLTTQKENVMTQTSATQQRSERAADKNAIRPFHASVPDAELTELRRRIHATKWPERETVADASQGV